MEITGIVKRAAAVMISAVMITGMCGSAMAEETGSPGGRENIAAEGMEAAGTGASGTETSETGTPGKMCIRDSPQAEGDV